MIQERQIGFSPEKEEKFLLRLDGGCRRVNLEQELKTQLAEDFGLVEFSLKFRLDEKGKIVDLLSGEEMVALQEKLTALGHDVGKIDGILGAATRVAIQKEQARLGLPADAWPTKDLLNGL